MILGVDTGGTFTDFVLVDGAGVRVHKLLSTPEAPERAILQGVRELGVDLSGLRLVHGSTVATNAVLEGKGARTVYVTNRGFADVLTIGRQARRDLYDLQPPRTPPPVPPELCLETGGRLGADGSVVEDLSAADLDALAAAVARLQPEAVAVNLLFSFLDDRFERAVAARMPKGVFVSCSSRVLPAYGEYERGIATWLNARVGPRVQGYLERLQAGVAPAAVAVMQSSGETIAARQAGDQAVRLLLSGPAGGLAGAAFTGRLAGEPRLLSFDMGGTSTDVALVDGAPRLTTAAAVGGFPVGVPMVDMHTIGAGGGSIAWLDAGGMLQVGPASAGAAPGPACYGQGGTEPTVTDANLVLGRLVPDAFLGGRMTLDPAAARAAVAALGRRLGLGPDDTAAGIVRIANEHMARALRVISVERGIDPRGMALAAFGGAGGLHLCALAEALGMSRGLVPVHGGVLSALGMIVAPPGRRLERTLTGLARELDDAQVEHALAGLADAARAALGAEGIPAQRVALAPGLAMRYRGQSWSLNVAWEGSLAAAAERFHQRHREHYGHALDAPVELVAVRLGATGPAPAVTLPRRPAPSRPAPGGPGERGRTHGGPAVWPRHGLAPGDVVHGPALITEAVATTWVARGWRCTADAYGNLLLERAGGR